MMTIIVSFLVITKSILITATNPSGPGLVFIQLISYQNPLSKTDTGAPCDGWFNNFGAEKCDLLFHVCLHDLDNTKSNFPCNIGSISTLNHVFQDSTNVRFGKSIGFIRNPFNFSLKSMPENVNVEIRVSDDDIGGPQLVSKLRHRLLLPMVTPDLGTEDMVDKLMLKSLYSEIVFRVYGRCRENYYGRGCGVFCRPAVSREAGFYGCDKKTGQKHCLIGWTGNGCKQRDLCSLENNPCHGSALCSMIGAEVRCSCPDTLTGQHCQSPKQPCDSNPCVNGGVCFRYPFKFSNSVTRCDCPRNFTGEFCQKDVDECESTSPCLNEGRCVNMVGSYKCICKNNHWGINCEKPPVFSVKGIDSGFLTRVHGSKEKFLQNIIIGLLIIVICLILISSLFFLLYFKNRATFTRSQSLGSVYTECHFDDKTNPIKDVEDYVNHYELETGGDEKDTYNLNFDSTEKQSLKFIEKESVI